MEIKRDDMRARIEKTLRALAPGDYGKPNNVEDEEFDAFLILRGPIGKEVLFYCDSELVSVEFGVASKHFEFAVEEEDEEKDDDIGGPAGFGENMLGEAVGDSGGDDDDDTEDDDDGEKPEAKAFSEEDLKALLKGVVQITLDIMQERVFAAEYKKGFARVARFHSAREFEAVKGMKDFASMSWKGRFDVKKGLG
jgi:hypothetical protein